MLATKFDTAVHAKPQMQPKEYERQRVSRQSTAQAKSRFDNISLFGCIVVCAVAGWVLASMSARAAGLNAQIVQLQSQIQQVSAVNASYSASLDKLTQPAYILQMAGKLGMKQGQPITIPALGSASVN